AALLIVPTLLSNAELSTAMPRSGGTYFFVSRSMGPTVGVVDGIGAWISMVAKCAFALVGIGYYIALVLGWDHAAHVQLFVKSLAVVLGIVLCVVNIRGIRKSATLQTGLVILLLGLCAYFIVKGFPSVDRAHFSPLGPKDKTLLEAVTAVIATAGLVFVSYAGLTKAASVSEEVLRPEKTMPLGMFAALLVTSVIYVLGVSIAVGTLPADELAGSRAPLAEAARGFAGTAGLVAMLVAGVLAFVSTANAGILSASRYLYAMGRDRALPLAFARVGGRDTPVVGIVFSACVTIAIASLLDAYEIAKLASTFLLVDFAAVNLSVIVMRESRVGSYDPGFRSPLYPWMQIAGVAVSAVLIPMMGWDALTFALGLFGLALVWYALYAHGRAEHAAAIRHVVERIATEILSREDAAPILDRELRSIMKEKGLRDGDPFARLISKATVLDLEPEAQWDDLMGSVVARFSAEYPDFSERIREELIEKASHGQTPAAGGVALPHLRLEGVSQYELVIARSTEGLHFPGVEGPVHAVFVLLGSLEDPQQHLRMLACIAAKVEDPAFLEQWLSAPDNESLRAVLAGGGACGPG
ncbi:MAG: amino acid permease, partial [Planctomycetota bacterium]